MTKFIISSIIRENLREFNSEDLIQWNSTKSISFEIEKIIEIENRFFPLIKNTSKKTSSNSENHVIRIMFQITKVFRLYEFIAKLMNFDENFLFIMYYLLLQNINVTFNLMCSPEMFISIRRMRSTWPQMICFQLFSYIILTN